LKGGPDRVRRNSEANPLRTATTRNDRRIDADYFPAQIDQRAAAIPGIDCRIGLEQIAERVRAIWSPLRTNDAVSHGFLKSVWVTELPLLVAKEKLERIEAVLPTDIDLLGRFHRDDGRDHAADERAALPVQRLKRCDLLGIYIRCRSQRVLFRRSPRSQIQRPMFKTKIGRAHV